MLNISPLLIGLILASLIAGAAWRLRALSLSGAVAAAVEGTIIFGLGGLTAAALLLAFFISSSLLSHLFARRKARLNEKFSKGSQRDAGQVLANGGIATLMMLLHGLFPEQSWTWVGFAGSLAAVNADTWATEIGVLSKSAPRLITNGCRVERGTSGAITPLGTLAALVGAALIALLFAALTLPISASFVISFALVSLAGLVGSLFDSLLGATFQAIYFCPVCQKETERHPLHACGSPTTLIRGKQWLNNDWVNTACALVGVCLALIFWSIHPAWFSSTQPVGTLTPTGEAVMSFPISSTSFEEGGLIPAKYTCDGENQSPALTWRDLPPNTRSLALITDDPDAPGGAFTHWVLYNLPPTLHTLPEGLQKQEILDGVGTQGKNSFRRMGYDGPCPPPGPAHRYYFTLYALDNPPTLPQGMDAAQLRKALQGHVLAEAQWVGRYAR